jgi:glutathione S-transferase
LSSNSNPNFLVGNNLTIADTSFGAWILKYVVADTFTWKAIFMAELNKFPKTKGWCMNTLEPCFGAWIKQQKVSPTGM